MGAGASASAAAPPYADEAAALADGKTQDEIDEYTARASADSAGENEQDGWDGISPDGDLKMSRVEEIKTVFDSHAADELWDCATFEVFASKGDPELTPEDAKAKFDTIDQDKDGKITYPEFFDYFFSFDLAVTSDAIEKKGLTESDMYVRVRPLAKEGEAGGHGAGTEAVNKALTMETWDEKGVTMKEAKGHVTYDFMRAVVLPESSQKEMYRQVAAHYDEAMSMQLTNVMMLAYGQTGTGKTHTMLGTKESLRSDVEHDDWGIFPRFLHTVLTRMRAVENDSKEPTNWVCTVSAIEFYMAQAYDLLDNKKMVIIDADASPVSATEWEVTKTSDLEPFMDEVNRQRAVSKTKMNAGSSRSHIALILTLHQAGRDVGEGEYVEQKLIFKLNFLHQYIRS
jgi:hypothetical protein